MNRVTSKEACCGCHACCTACPQNCIRMMADSEGFLYPHVNKQLCNHCGNCQNVCPMLVTPPHGEWPRAFAAWNCDAEIRRASSSGGIFSALMRQVFAEGGVVIGAAFDDAMVLHHRCAQTETESQIFRGSKYLQSVIGKTYLDAQLYLARGRRVLFSGTPCQIAGLYAFLGKDDVNLVTCDLVCHGVPSPKVFAAYKDFLELRYGANVQRISFRNKDRGWKRYSVSVSFDNGTEFQRVFTDDPFMLGFLRNTYLRPSCYSCPFSQLPRRADMSLADFWGVYEHHPEWDDDKGTSLVLIQTNKGKRVFDAIRSGLYVHETELSLAIPSNPCICKAVAPGKNRDAFFCDLDRLPFEKVMKRYMAPPTTLNKVIWLIKRVVDYAFRKIRLR